MGQLPNKYHVTNDGKVFVINPDGSTSECGHIQQDIHRKRKPKVTHSLNIAMWVVECISLIGLIAYIISSWYYIEDMVFYYDIHAFGYVLLKSVRCLFVICIVMTLIIAYLLFALKKFRGKPSDN